MNEQFLQYYNKELQFLREMGADFAREFPKIAGRLGLDTGTDDICRDPYVERLLEGFAFLAARVHLKLDAQFPTFTQSLLETVYPHYLAPTPSMALVQMTPDLGEGELSEGYQIPRGTVLRSLTGPEDATPCEYRTAHEATLYPVEVTEVQYLSRGLDTLSLPENCTGRAALRIGLRSMTGDPFQEIALDSLTFYLGGVGAQPMRLYEQIFAHCCGVVAREVGEKGRPNQLLDPQTVAQVGFDDQESLIPYEARSFQGYRLLHEYFAFAQRFMFVRVEGLRPAAARCEGPEMEVILLFDRVQAELEGRVDESHCRLFCAPVINLFPRRAAPIFVEERFHEFHVVPDRTAPLDYEVYRVSKVTGSGRTREVRREFLPFYALRHGSARSGDDGAYYTVERRRRVLSGREKQFGTRSSYVGSEVYVSLVDGEAAPYHPDLRQLHAEILCTNRDLPLQMPLGLGTTDFTLEQKLPITSVRCVSGPTRPQPAHLGGSAAWRAISHLTLNYLSLTDTEGGSGAAALHELLSLYCAAGETDKVRQIQGINAVKSREIVRRVSGPIAFARGLEVELTLDEAAFEGTGAFLIGAVLERFFAEYASINSFTETVIQSVSRGEMMRWPTRPGRQQTL